MAILLKPLRCPHCGDPMDKPLLRREGLLKPFLARKAFPCPHCQKAVIFPEKADTIVSMGLFVAVILAPLFHFWSVDFIGSKPLFALGAAITLAGLMTQKLNTAPESSL